jgi:hypothetical protein
MVCEVRNSAIPAAWLGRQTLISMNTTLVNEKCSGSETPSTRLDFTV